MLKAHLLIRARQGALVPDGLQGNNGKESRKGERGKGMEREEREGSATENKWKGRMLGRESAG